MLSVIITSVTMPSLQFVIKVKNVVVIILNVNILIQYHYGKHHYTKVIILSVIGLGMVMLSVIKTNVTMPSLKCAIMVNVLAPKVVFLPAIPTAVKTEAATAAKIVPAREKWTAGNVSFELGANVVSGSNDVIVKCHLPVNLS